MPVAIISRAVARAIASTSSGSSGGAEADVVREDDRAYEVGVPVHGVDAVEQRDTQAGGERASW
jgi:hypothetical protein